MGRCEEKVEGNLVSWLNSEWSFENVEIFEFDAKNLCEKVDDNRLYAFLLMTFGEAKYICYGMGGSLFIPKDLEEGRYVFDEHNHYGVQGKCPRYWIGLEETEEGVWVSHATGEQPQEIPWAPDEPNGVQFENCGGYEPEGVVDDSCFNRRLAYLTFISYLN